MPFLIVVKPVTLSIMPVTNSSSEIIPIIVLSITIFTTPWAILLSSRITAEVSFVSAKPVALSGPISSKSVPFQTLIWLLPVLYHKLPVSLVWSPVGTVELTSLTVSPLHLLSVLLNLIWLFRSSYQSWPGMLFLGCVSPLKFSSKCKKFSLSISP